MNKEYDRKFEEMKKYIPFLESMITRLEFTSSPSNPRQAQLDKIRSLRDLLLDKKKRMKMENLLKCEQVLVNLYAKVEQRDSLSGIMKAKEDSGFSIDSPTLKEKSELEAVRNKLKTVAKIKENVQDTLPEIATASEVEEIQTSGKEPALFQRRPNKSSISPSRHTQNKNVEESTKCQGSSSKRNYTRVLVSPEPGSSRRRSPFGKAQDKLLCSRRSPRNSPRRYSPSYSKRERKKSSKDSHSNQTTGINITLNVPEDSLNSLNTKDILPRIINCNDGDVDIDTLRELRKQILGELKKTGANDDISDLILKSYNKKRKPQRQNRRKLQEVEEGELSDSESEAIESIYGSLVVKEQNPQGQPKNVSDKDNRKIQICLVINSETDQQDKEVDITNNPNQNINSEDFEMFNKDEAIKQANNREVITIDDEDDKIKALTNVMPNIETNIIEEDFIQITNNTAQNSNIEKVNETIDESKSSKTKDVLQKPVENTAKIPSTQAVESDLGSQKEQDINLQTKDILLKSDAKLQKIVDDGSSKEIVSFKPNFYKPLLEPDNSESVSNAVMPIQNMDDTDKSQVNNTTANTASAAPVNNAPTIEDKLKEMESSVEIPLLHEPTVAQKPTKSIVSEIDILQALKNDILSESLNIPGSEITTPPLHQPKVIKVASALEILPKKRISIEKYKQKSVKPKQSATSAELNMHLKDDNMKKNSIKLTEKECERFNIPKISFDEDSSGDDELVKDDYSIDDIYDNLAPKSPDHDESSNTESTPPVIIPADPVKTAVAVSYRADVDMRNLPITSSTSKIPSLLSVTIAPPAALFEATKNEKLFEKTYKPPVVDPRIRREQRISIENPSTHAMNTEGISRPTFISSSPNVIPNMTPIMTPNARSYEMTPNHQTFDIDPMHRKMVYAPSFSTIEPRDREKSVTRETRPWEIPNTKTEPRRPRLDDRAPRSNSIQRDVTQSTGYSDSFSYKGTHGNRNDNRDERPYSRADCPLTPLPSFGRSEAPIVSGQTFSPLNPPFMRTDCPGTPSDPFARSDCPSTPTHSFGRADCPSTPSHPFGRSECPSTPIHPFGRPDGPHTPNQFTHNMFNRIECPLTPNHSFGATDVPPTPNHPFGRSECPMTPSHLFGRSECPKTPTHPFGRSDTSSQPFGRSEFNSKFTKDPRLNRKPECESRSQYNEKERDFYKDRGYDRCSSYKTYNKQYTGPDLQRNYETEHGRGDKYRCRTEKNALFNRREHTRFEPVRAMSRDQETDRGNREKSSRYESERISEDLASKRNQRERSVGKSVRAEANYRSTSRASSVGRSLPGTPDNSLSVKRDAGRSFTIDTSVNTTFQKLIESGKGIQVFDYSFDARRQRAASVGRSLPRVDVKPNHDQNTKREMFKRASSVGRDVSVPKNERSLQEIKADFQSYKSNTSKNKETYVKSKDNLERNNSRRDMFRKGEQYPQSTSNTSYSPRKNSRDPRVKKLNYKDPRTRRDEKERKSRGIDYSSDNIARGTILGSGCGVKNYKIPKIKRPVEEKPEEVEKHPEKKDQKEQELDSKKEKVKEKKQMNIKEKTYDSKTKEIEKVKPKETDKLKRVGKTLAKPKEVEKVKITPNEIHKVTALEDEKDKMNNIQKVKSDMLDFDAGSNDSLISQSDDHFERRVTRSSTKGIGELKSPESSPVKVRGKRYKKNILCDSDSDTENISKSKDLNATTSKKDKTPSPTKTRKPKTSDVDLNSSFGIDELEMFADNPVSDPVIDNINALIADLDNDIDTSKNDTENNFTKEIWLENMLETITSPEHNDSNSVDVNISTALKKTDENVENVSVQTASEDNKEQLLSNPSLSNDDAEKNLTAEKPGTSTSSDTFTGNGLKEGVHLNTKCDIEYPQAMSTAKSNSAILSAKSINEDIVSTSDINSKSAEDSSRLHEYITDNCSTPDSTINTDENIPEKVENEGAADSTNEVHNETNVTSTDSLEPKTKDESTTNKETLALDSVGSLLSLLQDKSKIKEILSMLGSNENEKIKKKLEKLSEIMSEEESDDKDDKIKVRTQSTDSFSGSNVPSESNIDESSVSNTGDESMPLDHNVEDIKTKVLSENVNQSTKMAENDNKDLPVEEDSKESHEMTPQLDDSIKSGAETVDAKGTEPEADESFEEPPKPKRKVTKKSKFAKKGKAKQLSKKVLSNEQKRVTRQGATVAPEVKVKKPSRELLKLQADIKEMFIRDAVLSSTGIRMCRLAKLVNDKTSATPETEPVVILEKFKNTAKKEDIPTQDKVKRKKPGPKPKAKDSFDERIVKDNLDESEKAELSLPSVKYKAGPKSKTKQKTERDPYAFETDSIETNTEKASDDELDSGSESSSVASSKSFGSTECLADVKKKTKRKRPSWQSGVIKPKNKKKKLESKVDSGNQISDSILNIEEEISRELVQIPDNNCFIDRTYCFRKNVHTYSCRFCLYTGNDIVHHYKKQHPHIEVPLSRMAPMTAKVAIEQSTEFNYQGISKVSSEKYVCIFCYQEFMKRSKCVLESFFWHVVSTHTGEYKQDCTECVPDSKCPFTLDIPSPPKDAEGQLMGYLCQKCNFTQMSLENIKAHVISRHNDEQTAVYTISLSVLSKKALNSLLRKCGVSEPVRVLRSSRSNQSLTEASDDCSDVTESSSRFSEPDSIEQKPKHYGSLLETETNIQKIQSKITFETDDNASSQNDSNSEEVNIPVKIEQNEPENTDDAILDYERPTVTQDGTGSDDNLPTEKPTQASDDIVDYPHFKISFTDSGAKEYICCINRQDKHFKTTLLISMKKHVQMKHPENWDGYCYICKVIVTPQGAHLFKDCFQHYLDKHMDNFPVLEHEVAHYVGKDAPVTEQPDGPTESGPVAKPYIHVRPLCELITKVEETNFPKIENVVSLGTPVVELPRPSPTYPPIRTEKPTIEKQYKYEEAQAEVMSKKHRVVLDAMMSRVKLTNIYKCAGRFCSFTTDSTEDALLHASTHQRIGGIDALNCAYCDFDAAGNAIDLVMHMCKAHGNCQYSCGQCFYRAAASQLVGAHMTRMHPSSSPAPVLRTTAATAPASEINMLTREQAVQYYTCAHTEHIEKCKFRTYTPDKFSEHLQQRHGTATTHPCDMCPVYAASPNELVVHMMSHGLKLYQCTWCVHGADKESDLLAHVSAMHPSKQPQAYLRIITNKDGTNELRVLPLAFLNKAKILTEDVVTSGSREDPVREAERSIELEKLIGHANLIIEAANQSVEQTPPVDEQIPNEVITPPIETVQTVPTVSEPETPPVVPSVHATPPRSSTPLDINLQTTPILKTEPPEPPKDLPDDIVVLDSDEEEPRPVIEIADEPPPTAKVGKRKIVPMHLLHKCPKCHIMCKTMRGMQKHLMACLAQNTGVITCPHCSVVLHDKKKVISHYLIDHRDGVSHECGDCGLNFTTLANVRRHVRISHQATDMDVAQKVENGVNLFVVTKISQQRVQPKRKLSSNSTEAPVAKRSYRPHEIDLLPINPILDQLVFCSVCEFSTKVRVNMVRHLQMHAEQQPVPQTAPVNPVPHLETNEKHFDKMVNLASSSIVTRTPDKQRSEGETTVTLLIPPEAASKYPKYVPDRQRLTCGAKGCAYISVDEHMLKCHWETLHSGTNTYHCVHCPPHQHLDTSKPLTATRILGHLKMHDVPLYACSACTYYHFKKEAVEKHLSEVHKSGKLVIVREEASSAPPLVPTQSNAAPTMDLKAWQCGLCKFKSMLRPDVIDHCAKFHQSKMQFKCGYCPFRTSALENINKHQTNAHQGKPEDVFYYYYREGSVPDEPDGTSCWQKQRQKCGVSEAEIKTEAQVSPPPSPAANSVTTASTTTAASTVTAPMSVDLNLVKKEVADEVVPGMELDIKELCKRFGEFTEPNGLHFTCPLCKVISEDNREAMQGHLYEELKYRRWGCGLCSYKAFHKNGLNDHIASEHRRHFQEPVKLPVDINMEKWVQAHLDHQQAIIEKNRGNLAKLKQAIIRNSPGPSSLRELLQVPGETVPRKEAQEKYSDKDLATAFGPFGEPTDMDFCCPKCQYTTKDEMAIKDHLESELTKIRWCCSSCTSCFQTYHEAQYHVKSHTTESARPKEAVRDPAMRSCWISTVIQTQKQAIKSSPISPAVINTSPEKIAPEIDNSLLVVRYEENVATPEDTRPVRRKRQASDSDDERLVIDGPSQKKGEKSCQFCDYKTKYVSCLKDHVPKHFNLKPYTCGYCDFSSYRQGVINHIQKSHPGYQTRVKCTEIPPELIAKYRKTCLICLFCEKPVSEEDMPEHMHDNVRPDFAKKGDVVVKCCICLALRIDVKSLQEHHNSTHPDIPINYALFKLHYDTRETNYCGYCQKGFKYIRDLRTHHNAVHSGFQLMYTSTPFVRQNTEEEKRKVEENLPRRCARKSTTKLPNCKSVAKKSTTKLPGDSQMEYSYYNTEPSLEEYDNVTTIVSVCNTMMPFTFKKLREFLKVEPKVLVKDIQSDLLSSDE